MRGRTTSCPAVTAWPMSSSISRSRRSVRPGRRFRSLGRLKRQRADGDGSVVVARRFGALLGFGLALLVLPWPAAGATQGAWTIEPVAIPAALSAMFEAVSCPSPTMCMAVGSGSFDRSTISPVVARWDGTQWLARALPILVRGGVSLLTSVSCPSTAMCVAVGWSYSSRDATPRAIFERWDASGWRPMPALPPPGQQGVYVWGVDCSGPGACVAVGATYRRYGYRPLVERWDGDVWTPAATMEPSSLDLGELYSVSCGRTGACVGVGAEYDFANRPLAVRTDGSSLSVMDTPTAPGAGNSGLSSVSCAARNNCVAVGVTQPPWSPKALPLVERWDGSRWTIEGVPATGDSVAYLTDVSCASRTSCVAVGASDPAHGAAVLRWNGALWQWEAADVPVGSLGEQFGGVSCVGSGGCTAVGRWSQSHRGLPLVEYSEG